MKIHSPVSTSFVDRDIGLAIEVANLPAWVVALVAAGGLAAALHRRSCSLSFHPRCLMTWVRASSIPTCPSTALAVWPRVARSFLRGISAFILRVLWHRWSPAFGLAITSFFPVIILGIFACFHQGRSIAGMLCELGFTAAYIYYSNSCTRRQALRLLV